MRFAIILSSVVCGFYLNTPVASADPAPYNELFQKARSYEKQQALDEAMAIYQRLIELDASRPEAFNNLANIMVTRNDFSRARQLLEQALKTSPAYATVHDNLSRLYVEMAKDSYDKALRLQGHDHKAFALTALEPPAVQTAVRVAVQDPVKPDLPVASKTGPKVEAGPKAEPVPVAGAETPANQQRADMMATLQGWAAAWSRQAADAYLDFYAESYHPPGVSRQAWEKKRKLTLSRPEWIKVELKEMEIKPLNNTVANVKFVQLYRASNYQDVTRKAVQLRQTSDGWRIVAERTISKIN